MRLNDEILIPGEIFANEVYANGPTTIVPHSGTFWFVFFFSKALKWIVRYSFICSPFFKRKNGPCKTGQRLINLYLLCRLLVKIFVQLFYREF